MNSKLFHLDRYYTVALKVYFSSLTMTEADLEAVNLEHVTDNQPHDQSPLLFVFTY